MERSFDWEMFKVWSSFLTLPIAIDYIKTHLSSYIFGSERGTRSSDVVCLSVRPHYALKLY